MKRLFFTLLACTALASAQELHTFSNGEVADAEKINQNFEALKSEISGGGGCSAEQDGSSVVITCADGTSGILASQGSVVILEGAAGELPDLTVVEAGTWYVVDSIGNVLSVYSGSSTSIERYSVVPITIDNVSVSSQRNVAFQESVDDGSTRISPYATSVVVFDSSDCTGPAFLNNNYFRFVEYRSGEHGFVSYQPTSIGTINVKSQRNGGYFSNQTYYPPSECEQVDYLSHAVPLVPYAFPEQIKNPAYPLRVEQLD